MRGRADAGSRTAGGTETEARTPFRVPLRPDGYNGKAGIAAVEKLGSARHVWNRLRSETDHELRAALIYLLTAALAEKGTAAIIGEAEGEWFWLPPWSLWEPWAKEGLESAEKRMALKFTSVLDRPFPLGKIRA
jgi:hypothetical protein